MSLPADIYSYIDIRARLLVMEFPGQATIDAIILTGSTIFTFVSIAYIALLWSMRRDFYVVLR